MKKKIINLTAILSIIFLGTSLIFSTPTYAWDETTCVTKQHEMSYDVKLNAGCFDVCQNPHLSLSVKEAAGCGMNDSEDTIKTIIVNIIDTILGIIGVVALVYVIMGGVQYMTSSGDAAKLKKARDTIIYALIGLVIVGLAFAITNFTIDAINRSDDTVNSQNTPATPRDYEYQQEDYEMDDYEGDIFELD